MLIKRRQIPLDYSLCNQTVTIYHRKDLRREVRQGVHYEYRRRETVKTGQTEKEVGFLLVIPGKAELEPGDKVAPGIGPELTGAEGWARLTADDPSGLGIIQTVYPWYWQGEICHMEARG